MDGMRFSILGLIGAVVLAMGVFVVWSIRRARFRPQFGMRALLLAVTAIALMLGAALWWRDRGLARTAWYLANSPQDRQLIPATSIVPADDRFCLRYQTRRCSVSDLMKSLPLGTNYSAKYGDCEIEVTTQDRSRLTTWLAAMQKADVLGPGFVIRGRVTDASGDAVAGATVDLMGNYVYINHFRTRADGTFTMPVDAPAGGGYYLNIRPRKGTPQYSRSFSLSPLQREMVALIQVD